jgi:TM2 domain-containing membrane protein YozV
MPNATPPRNPPSVVPTYHALPALLSYLVPGLGQIYQGRVGKGILFLVCIYGLFFYGMALGDWKNVYLPDTAKVNDPLGLSKQSPTLANLYNRPQFLGQFWVGVAAWPAVIQYNSKDPNPVLGSFQRDPGDTVLNELQTNGDKTWDLGWVYTVIAGVLNIMVIYDALAGPAFLPTKNDPSQQTAGRPAAAAAHT